MYRIIPSLMTLGGRYYLDNLLPLVVETDADVLSASVLIASGNETVASVPLRYTPVGGRVSIDLSDILRPFFSFKQVPSEQRFVRQTHMMLSVSVSFFGESVHGIAMDVLRGGISGVEGSIDEWCRANALSWQSRRKYVLYNQPETLTLYLKANDFVSFSIHTRKGENPIKAVTGQAIMVPSTGVYTFDVSPAAMSRIADIEDGAYIAYYEVQSSGGAAMQYVLDGPKSEDERWFFWENSLGGMDTIRCYGEEILLLSSEDKTISRGDVTATYEVEAPMRWKQNTGSITLRERMWLLDFFRSPFRYCYRNGSIHPIVLVESSGEIQTGDNIYDYSFSYELSDRKPAFDVAIIESVPSSLGLPTSAPINFTLPPQPSDFALVAPGEGVFFAAFSAGAWGVVGYNQLMSALQAGLKVYLDKLVKDYVAWYLSQEHVQSSSATSILAPFQSQLKVLRASADELKKNALVASIVKTALFEADQAAQAALDALRDYLKEHHTVDADAQEKIMLLEDALTYYGRVIYIAQKSLTDKLTDQMLQQLHIVSEENNTTALGYATAAQQAAFEASQLQLSAATMSLGTAITHTQNLSVFVRSTEGLLLQSALTSTLSVGVRFNGKDITSQVLQMEPAVNFVWRRLSKTGIHDGMTDAEWDASAFGRHEIVIKRALNDQLRFWLETSEEDDARIIEQFKHKTKI